MLLLASHIEVPDVDHFILDQFEGQKGFFFPCAIFSKSKSELSLSIGNVNQAMPLLRALQPQLFCDLRDDGQQCVRPCL